MKRDILNIEKIKFGEYLVLFPCLTEDSQKASTEYLKAGHKPMFVAGRETPRDLNGLTYGQLCDIQQGTEQGDGIVNALRVVMGLQDEEIYNERAAVVIGCVTWISKEAERINRLFAKIAPSYTAEQLQAGARGLQFGTFGVLDWYAKRQGIADQNEVRSVPWVRIYTCMRNDGAVAAYEQRLNKIITDKIKRK